MKAELLEEFKRIYSEECGEELADAEVLEMATALLRIFRIVYQPIPPEKLALYEKKRYNDKVDP